MKHVKFKQMKDGDKEDYLLLKKLEDKYVEGTADRIMKTLKHLDTSLEGYQVSRLEHSLQTATRALRDELAPHNHSEFAASIIRPFVSEKTSWIIEKHGIFQMYYYAHHYNYNKDEREKYRGHPHFNDCAKFCENWDQASFDPNYETIPLSDFEPMVKRIFNRQPYSLK